MIVGGAAAYGYWSTSGGGSGSATTSADNAAGNVTVTQVGTTTGLVPGGTPSDVVVKVNNTNPGSVKVGKGTATIDAFTAQANGALPACTAADFSLVSDTTTNSAGIIASAASSANLSVITIQLVNSTTLNQDNCKSVTPTLTFT